MARDPVALIHAFNAGREPERLALKYQAMAKDPFAFLRGSCHLFYQDYAAAGRIIDAPPVWICGDLHLENFGSYLGDDRRAYFGLNDFGESLLAPADWELSRFLVSVLVGAETLELKRKQALSLCRLFLTAYAEVLASGKIDTLDGESAKGMVRDLLDDVSKHDDGDFLAERTQVSDGNRRLRLDRQRALAISKADREKVEHGLATFAATQPNPKFFKLLDVARRIAGTGSLGIERYVILVKGSSESAPSLLDLRHEPGSALAPYVAIEQPAWPNEAARAVGIQRRMQGNTPAFLNALVLGERAYVLRELLPSQDRLSLENWNGKLGRLERVMTSMGNVLAWAQLRSAGQQGAASTDTLKAFAAALPLTPLLTQAENYAKQVIDDWRVFASEHRTKN